MAVVFTLVLYPVVGKLELTIQPSLRYITFLPVKSSEHVINNELVVTSTLSSIFLLEVDISSSLITWKSEPISPPSIERISLFLSIVRTNWLKSEFVVFILKKSVVIVPLGGIIFCSLYGNIRPKYWTPAVTIFVIDISNISLPETLLREMLFLIMSSWVCESPTAHETGWISLILTVKLPP